MAPLDSDAPEAQQAQVRQTHGPLFYVGAGGLIVVMIVETCSVIGRHLGWPLLGAIEVIQAAILLSACAAMVLATINRVHATVHLLTDRLSARPKRWLGKSTALLSALFFAGLTAGVAWLAADFWQAYEESELLHIPFKPLRLLTAVAAASVACIFFMRALSRTKGHKQ